MCTQVVNLYRELMQKNSNSKKSKGAGSAAGAEHGQAAPKASPQAKGHNEVLEEIVSACRGQGWDLYGTGSHVSLPLPQMHWEPAALCSPSHVGSAPSGYRTYRFGRSLYKCEMCDINH